MEYLKQRPQQYALNLCLTFIDDTSDGMQHIRV